MILRVIELNVSDLLRVKYILSDLFPSISSLFIGLVIGILQAATSINEATLSFIPKLAALAITLAVVGGWQLTTLVDYTRGIFQRIPGLFT